MRIYWYGAAHIAGLMCFCWLSACPVLCITYSAKITIALELPHRHLAIRAKGRPLRRRPTAAAVPHKPHSTAIRSCSPDRLLTFARPCPSPHSRARLPGGPYCIESTQVKHPCRKDTTSSGLHDSS